ncbi:hypothetical protein [Streptomyces capitiformicae]|uniref:hypothetical protein n=1 Tax=Streptomyces capitiformicae TaxID=2014920 RepID=UPI001AD7EABB|nr:hypothetical protein [Streptomyces capitiformicae]
MPFPSLVDGGGGFGALFAGVPVQLPGAVGVEGDGAAAGFDPAVIGPSAGSAGSRPTRRG